jgi:hypothetical protein
MMYIGLEMASQSTHLKHFMQGLSGRLESNSISSISFSWSIVDTLAIVFDQ